jgi:eukaryotic-like serine/threonine-protein kinase
VGSIVGTPEFMAPEQAVDARSVDERADIYSLGCTLCFLLTGKPPYAGESVFERLMAHREQPIPKLSALRRDVPASLDRLFARMLAKKAADRAKSLDDVITVLDEMARSLAQASVVAEPPMGTALGAPTEARATGEEDVAPSSMVSPTIAMGDIGAPTLSGDALSSVRVARSRLREIALVATTAICVLLAIFRLWLAIR